MNKNELIDKWLNNLYDNNVQIPMWIRKNIKNNKLKELEILINGSTKTGTSSLQLFFKKMSGLKVEKCHMMKDWLKIFNRNRKNKVAPPYEGFHINDFYKFLGCNNPDGMIIVEVVREPIERLISIFFQNIEETFRHVNNEFNTYKKFEQYYLNNIDELVSKFNNGKLGLNLLLKFSFENWKIFGFDIYHQPFDKLNTINCYNNNDKHYVVIKFPHIDDVLKSSSIINLYQKYGKNIPKNIFVKNAGKDKEYKNLYTLFKKNYHCSNEQFNKIYEKYSKFVNLCFTDEEINNRRERYVKD